ncbi:MAG TPA: DUF502 domain-containing protein [Bacteroidales bacterium]|nr:DUF502 domain-containing protein [Bacteroidales bacterium]
MKRSLTRRLINYFFQGLLYIAPVTLTVWGLKATFEWIDSLLIGLLDDLLKVHIPGLGVVVLILTVTLAGFLGTTILFKPLLLQLDKFLSSTPLVKIVYTAFKDLIEAFVGQKKRFNEPVLVKVGKGYELEKIGFITNKDLAFLGIPDHLVAVYLPHSYAWSGNLFIVPAENVRTIDASPTEVMKFIISAGVTNLESQKSDATEKKS